MKWKLVKWTIALCPRNSFTLPPDTAQGLIYILVDKTLYRDIPLEIELVEATSAMHQAPWSDAETKRALAMKAQRIPAKRMAVHLNSEFGHDRTSAMVNNHIFKLIGKARRREIVPDAELKAAMNAIRSHRANAHWSDDDGKQTLSMKEQDIMARQIERPSEGVNNHVHDRKRHKNVPWSEEETKRALALSAQGMSVDDVVVEINSIYGNHRTLAEAATHIYVQMAKASPGFMAALLAGDCY
jgi:hypothetical protein